MPTTGAEPGPTPTTGAEPGPTPTTGAERRPSSSPGPATESTDPGGEAGQVALIAALLELERHVRESGWDQPPRLFALVVTDELIATEPALASALGLVSTADGGPEGGLTAVEQDEFSSGDDLVEDLAGLEWPESVFGCAVSVERTFLPPSAEDDIPEDPAEAAAFVATHAERQDVRVVVGVDRAGHTHGVARLVSRPEELLAADNLVPGLVQALAHTLM
jgi:hypothetical protein